LKKKGKRFERYNYKATARHLKVNLILKDIRLGCHSNLDDLAPELVTAVSSKVEVLKSPVHKRLNSLTLAAAVVIPTAACTRRGCGSSACVITAGATNGGATCYGIIDGGERAIICGASTTAARTRSYWCHRMSPWRHHCMSH
jgi:hypothetical protein